VDLLTAFRIFGPQLGDTEADRARGEAAEQLLDTLKRLVERLPRSSGDDAVQLVLTRLCQVGPRGIRVGDPESDKAVERYLTTAVWNAAKDLRRARGLQSIDDVTEATLRSPGPSPDEVVGQRERMVELVRIDADLRYIIQQTAETLPGRASESFRTDVEQLFQIADGRTTFTRIVEEEMATTGDAAKARNRLYKRYQRVFDQIVECIGRRAEAGELTPTRQQLLLQALDALRLRPKS